MAKILRSAFEEYKIKTDNSINYKERSMSFQNNFQVIFMRNE